MKHGLELVASHSWVNNSPTIYNKQLKLRDPKAYFSPFGFYLQNIVNFYVFISVSQPRVDPLQCKWCRRPKSTILPWFSCQEKVDLVSSFFFENTNLTCFWTWSLFACQSVGNQDMVIQRNQTQNLKFHNRLRNLKRTFEKLMTSLSALPDTRHTFLIIWHVNPPSIQKDFDAIFSPLITENQQRSI